MDLYGILLHWPDPKFWAWEEKKSELWENYGGKHVSE